MQRSNCQAVILGASLARWSEPPVALAPELIAIRTFLRKITNAPILLAVAFVNAQETPTNQWVKAFEADGLDKWDGFAFTGFHNFAGFKLYDRPKLASLPEFRSTARWSPIFGTTRACGIAAPHGTPNSGKPTPNR